MTEDKEAMDLLYGVPAIAEFMGLERSRVYYLHRKGTIPTFPIDGIVAARKSSLISWLAAKEANARKLTEPLPPGAGEDAREGE